MTKQESLLESLKDLEETLELTSALGSETVVRKTFRVPVNDQTPVELTIAGVPYRVANISEGGLGFLADSGDLAAVGQRMLSVNLRCKGRDIQGKGTVRHVTPLEDGGFLYGLSLDLEEDDLAFMVDFVHKARERFFAQG
ncbi:PilZ domain-containing protein [Desulfosoma sp.]